MYELALLLIAEAKETRATSLDLGNCGLTELPDELFELTWLKELIMTYNEDLSDIGLLKNLKVLQQLDISETQVSDLSPLKDLTQLQQLYAISTQVSDLSPLKDLTQLQHLSLISIQVSDLSPLKDLTQLQHLDISNTQVSDLSPLKNLTQLQRLNIPLTQVSDLSPLKDLTQLQYLDISDTQVSDLSPLKDLTQLQYLDISDTQVSDLSPLKDLTKLQQLNVTKTKTSDLSPLKNLTALQELSVNKTKISDLSPLKDLKQLQRLSVSETQVSDLSPISKLVELKYFDAYLTQIKDLFALTSLINLIEISLYRTEISDLSPLENHKKIKVLDIESTLVKDLSPLKGRILKGLKVKWRNPDGANGIFILYCNKLSYPPTEIAKQGSRAIRNYFRQIEDQGGSEDINETKLLIVGEGGTGKTTLFEKLKDSNHNPLTHPTAETHGINILEGLQVHADFRANLWDFGGQELQYMTHQFFLTPRALYVLMMDARKESPNLSYWFKIISLLGRDSDSEKAQVLLVFNKRKGTTGIPQYHDLLKHYAADFDYKFLEVDFADNNADWDYLKQNIEQRLQSLAIKMPKQWLPIREALREEAKKHPHISMHRFSEICTEHRVPDEQDQLVGIKALHKLGQVLYFDEKGLRSHLILSPKWAVTGVYTFLDDTYIKDHNGYFTETEFVKILCSKAIDDKRYTRHDADLILQLMTRNHFDICYKSKGGNNYVAAQLLPDNRPPQYKWHPEVVKGGALQFRYQYPTMPKGLISRLIVRLSDRIEMIEGVEVVWKKGAILRFEKDGHSCRVLIREDDAESKTSLRQIIIDVMGEPSYRKFALQKVRDEVEDLHARWFRNIHADEIVPCCCSVCRLSDTPKSFLLKELLDKLQYNKTMNQCLGDDVPIQHLLEGIYADNEIEKLRFKEGLRGHDMDKRQNRFEAERMMPDIHFHIENKQQMTQIIQNNGLNEADVQLLKELLAKLSNDKKEGLKTFVETLPEPEDEDDKQTYGKQIIKWLNKNAEGIVGNVAASVYYDTLKHLLGIG